MSPMNSSGNNALLILQCHCLGAGGQTSTLLSITFGIFIYKYLFYRHFEIIEVTCFWQFL